MSKYEADTKYLFVNTEDLATTDGGDQVNKFKLNLGTNPISSDDNSLIKLSLTQFNMAKNFYNINSTNNALRLYLEGFTHNTMTFETIDKIIKIPPGDYLTFEIIILNLCKIIEEELLDSCDGGATPIPTIKVLPLGNSNSTSGDNAVYEADDEIEGQSYTGDYVRSSNRPANDNYNFPNEHIHQYNTGLYCISITITKSGTTFDRTASEVRFPIIQGLHIPPSQGQVVLSNGTILTADEQFNDSYSIFGIPRTTTFVTNPTETQGDRMGIVKGLVVSGFALANQFPRNQGIDTCQYVYLRANLANNLATTNLEATTHNHQGNSVGSHILGKIPRITNSSDGYDYAAGVYFRSDRETGYSMIVSANMINEIEFSVTDKSGRVIPQSDVGVLVRNFGGADSVFETLTKKINVDGNLFCDFTLKVERLSISNQPNVLQGTPDIKRASVNPIQSSIPINFNNNCGF